MVLTRKGEEADDGEGQSEAEESDPLDKSARTRGREVKTAVVSAMGARLPGGKRSVERRTHVTVLGTADALFSLLWTALLQQCLLGPKTLVVIVADGSSWIWNRATMFSARRQQGRQ